MEACNWAKAGRGPRPAALASGKRVLLRVRGLTPVRPARVPTRGKRFRVYACAHQATRLASVHPETLSFWNPWLNSDFWGRKARRFWVSCGCTPLQSETTLTAGADNASGTHYPGHYIRSVCAARDRLGNKKAMSQWLDGQRQLTSVVAGDLRRGACVRPAGADCRRRACCAALCSSNSASSVTRSWKQCFAR